jgi:ethanolamine permease
MPKGIILGMLTLIVSAFMILWLNASVANGSFALGKSGEPLLDGFKAIYGEGIAKVLALVAVVGLIASFHTIIFAKGRQIYSLSRAGYFPRGLSITHDRYRTPHFAMIAGAIVALIIMLGIWFALGAEQGTAVIGGTLLNMAVFGAMCSYIFQGVSFLMLRKNLPDIPRPYRSPFGNAGAIVTIVLALVTIAFQLIDPIYRQGVYGVALWFAIGLIYFAAVGRHKLVLSPEEEFAMSRGTAEYRSH